MGNAFSLKARLWLAVVASFSVLSLTWSLGSPAAQASTSPYCNNQTLSNYGACAGASRTLYQTYGWGDSRSVCVWWRFGGWGSNGNACSSGPGVGVYSAVAPTSNPWEPGINVNAAGSSVVHGVALQP
jgi:hypothetical protein